MQNVLLCYISVSPIYFCFLVSDLLWAIHSFICSFTFLHQRLSSGWKLPLLCWKSSDSWWFFCQAMQNFYRAFFCPLGYLYPLGLLILTVKIQSVYAERVLFFFLIWCWDQISQNPTNSVSWAAHQNATYFSNCLLCTSLSVKVTRISVFPIMKGFFES